MLNSPFLKRIQDLLSLHVQFSAFGVETAPNPMRALLLSILPLVVETSYGFYEKVLSFLLNFSYALFGGKIPLE